MYLSRIELDTKRRTTMIALASPNLIHGAIEASFPGARRRKLWRIDKLGERTYVLLLSDEEPQLAQMAKQFGVTDNEKLWETKDYSNLLSRIKNNSEWHFRLTANPTRSCRTENGKRGVVHAHITPYYQKKWLMERSAKLGFSLEEDKFSVIEKRWQRFYKGDMRKKPVTLLAVTYEGVLKVLDSDKFCKTLLEGIGRGKAFGMGLMTVVKAGDP